MTREEAKKELSKMIFELGFEDNVDDKVYALNMAIKALSQEPCDDAISREDAINALANVPCYSGSIKSRMVGAIKGLPSVTQKSGKWILLDECANSGYYCSNCQKKLVKEGWSQTVKKIKYCPNCGAKMESEE